MPAGEVTLAVLPTPNPRAPLAVAKALGLDAKRQLQDGLWTAVGDTGAVQPLLLLVAALERARAGDLVLPSATATAPTPSCCARRALRLAAAASVAQQIEVKRTLPSYGRYARFRHLMRKESGLPDVASPVVAFRDRRSCCRCTAAGAPDAASSSFHAIAPASSAATRGLEDVTARRGAARSSRSPTTTCTSSPIRPPRTPWSTSTVAAGSTCELTDCEAERVAVDMPVELTFRRLARRRRVPQLLLEGEAGLAPASAERNDPMDFGFSEEQEMLRSSARDFLAKEAPMTYVRKMMEDEARLHGRAVEEDGGARLDGSHPARAVRRLGARLRRPHRRPRGDGPCSCCRARSSRRVVLGGVAVLEGGSDALKQARTCRSSPPATSSVTLAQLEPSGRWDADGITLDGEAAGGGLRPRAAPSSSCPTRTSPT